MFDEVARPFNREPEHEQALASEEVGRAPAEQQEAAEEEGVDVDDPLQADRREVEAGLDRRQRDVHDGRVEHDHELRDADENENEPTVDGRTHCEPASLSELNDSLKVAVSGLAGSLS
jgi:hypothetical protein